MGGVVDAIKLPQWAMPKTTRSFALHFSIVAQLDGLMAKCRGMGARIARDVLATSELSALCHVHGYDPWMSTGSFCGLYLCDFEFMRGGCNTVSFKSVARFAISATSSRSGRAAKRTGLSNLPL